MFLLVTAAALRGQAAAAPLAGAARWADSARRLLDRGVITGDTVQLAQGVAVARKALGAFPGHPLLLHYAGYGLYRQAQRMTGDAQRARFEDAVALLEESAAAQPMPETFALLASAKGSMIGDSMVRAMRLGPAASAAEARALELGPTNPRVLILTGASALYKPSAFGGGEDRAHERFTRAIRAFDTDHAAAPMPSWGKAEAYAWLGVLEARRGRKAEASAAYDRALALEPDYAWVKFALKPTVARGQ
jgi:tetratricopeptide (TPR) repeat protein